MRRIWIYRASAGAVRHRRRSRNSDSEREGAALGATWPLHHGVTNVGSSPFADLHRRGFHDLCSWQPPEGQMDPTRYRQICGTKRICAIRHWNFVYFESLPLRQYPSPTSAIIRIAAEKSRHVVCAVRQGPLLCSPPAADCDALKGRRKLLTRAAGRCGLSFFCTLRPTNAPRRGLSFCGSFGVRSRVLVAEPRSDFRPRQKGHPRGCRSLRVGNPRKGIRDRALMSRRFANPIKVD